PAPAPEPKPEPAPEPAAEPKSVSLESGVKVARDAAGATKSLPVFTLRFAEIDKLLAVAKKIAGIAEVSESQFDAAVASVLENVKGLNKTEPIGLVFRANGDDFNDPLLILPIDDLSKFSIPSLPFLEVKKIEDGKFGVSVPNFDLVAYQKKGYAVVVLEASTSPVPADPKKTYLSELEKYTFGAKVDFANTSHEAIVKLAAPFVLIMSMQSPEQGEQFQQSLEMMKLYFDEFKTISCGYEIDPKTLDVELTTKLTPAGSSKIFSTVVASYKDRKTIFGGFKSSKPAILKYGQSINIKTKYKLPENFTEFTLKTYDPLFNGFLNQIEEDAENEDEVKYAKAAVDAIKKLMTSNMDATAADLAALVDVDGTFLAGTILEDTESFTKLFNSIVGFAKAKDSDLLKTNFKQNFEKASGFDLSSLTIPFKLGDVEKKLPKLAGKSYTFFVAIKDKTAVVVAGGFDADKTKATLKTALESTSSQAQLGQPMSQFDFQTLGQFLKNIGLEDIDKGEPGEGTAKKIIDLMTSAGDKAKMTIEEKVEGTDYVVSAKVDGKVVETTIKIVKQVQKAVSAQNDDEEDEDDDN
ncbi:MAG: hypothetical protein LBK06_09515, partial [Planctomycetaceae bacterium]|nr:hypothetical protein [Planctomycetaceae bacterium]